jgi:hypothetical protein
MASATGERLKVPCVPFALGLILRQMREQFLRAGDADAPTALVAHFLRLCHRLTAVLVVVSKRPAFPVERTVAVCRLAMDLNGDGIRAVKWVAMR